MTNNSPENLTEAPANLFAEAEMEAATVRELCGANVLERLADAETTLKCMLETILALENKFGMRFMARGEFYGVEFKAKN